MSIRSWFARRKKLLIWLTVVAAVIGVATAVFLLVFIDSKQDREELKAALAEMQSWLRKVGENVPGERERIVENFFRLYTQSYWGVHEITTKHHPDTHFLSRLPDQIPEAPRDLFRRWRSHALREYVRQRAMQLLNALGEPITETDAAKLVKQCIEKWQYGHWWKNIGTHKLEVLKLDSPALGPAKLLVFYALFCRDTKPPKDIANVAQQMLQDLRQWGVKGLSEGDCEHRPYLVFACYFQLLSQKHFSKEDLGVDCYPRYFVYRLPAEPVSDDGMFNAETDLHDRLSKLLSKISQKQAQQSVEVVLQNIRQAMDYDAWLVEFKKLVPTTEEDKTPGQLLDFVNRFSKQKR